MSRFIFAGNEIIPGTVVMTADGTITPKDDLRVILNISGGGTVSLSDGTDVTQRMELVNVSADTCSLTYKGTGGSTTASIYTNTGIRLLWVGSYWETSMSTAITGIDDNGQPFAFNIDALTHADGVINLTGTDANGNPFDYGLGRLVTNADEDNLVTGVEVKTSKTFNGKPVYKTVVQIDNPTLDWSTISYGINNINYLISAKGRYYSTNGYWTSEFYRNSSSYLQTLFNTQNFRLMATDANTNKAVITLEYTKTTDD